jgi:hypothetical protein
MSWDSFTAAVNKAIGRKDKILYDVQRLNVKDGDVVIIRFKEHISEIEYHRMQQVFNKMRLHMKIDFKTIIIEGDASISVLGKQEGR